MKHKGTSRKDTSDNFALSSDSLSVNNAYPANPLIASFFDVVFNNRSNLTRRDRVQVENILKRDDYSVRKWVV